MPTTTQGSYEDSPSGDGLIETREVLKWAAAAVNGLAVASSLQSSGLVILREYNGWISGIRHDRSRRAAARIVRRALLPAAQGER